jgi:hypothetical protein
VHRIGGALRLERFNGDEIQRVPLVIGKSDFDSSATDIDPEEHGFFGFGWLDHFLVGHTSGSLGIVFGAESIWSRGKNRYTSATSNRKHRLDQA